MPVTALSDIQRGQNRINYIFQIFYHLSRLLSMWFCHDGEWYLSLNGKALSILAKKKLDFIKHYFNHNLKAYLNIRYDTNAIIN
jgi:hypothetical protein